MVLDAFTEKRMLKFVRDYRAAQGQLPSLNDLEGQGFSKAAVSAAVRKKLLRELYVTMTNGTIIKGYAPD